VYIICERISHSSTIIIIALKKGQTDMGKKSKSSKKNKHLSDNSKDDDRHDDVVEDRFVAAETRPQFRAPKPSSTKVVLDERFVSVLTDPRFQLQEKDKYGRKQKKNEQQQQKETAKKELESFYVVKDNDNYSDAADEHRKDDGSDKATKMKNKKDDDESSDDEEKVEDPASRIAYLTALSRGELDVSSSSDDDDSSQSSSEDDDGNDGEDPVYGTAGILDPSTQHEEAVEISYDPSPFLVVTNMDWENFKAVDIFAILSSFAPPGGVSKVQVYQSDFGMERMEKDKLYGPTGIWKKKKKQKKNGTTNEQGEDGYDDEDDNDQESAESENESESDLDHNPIGIKIEEEDIADETDFDPEKLRAYEASKLKYYFAVVKFLNPRHADVVYREVDGLEFEHSSAAIDLRTLPPEEVDNVISGRPLRDEATSVPGNYDPPDFIVSALQQTNVQCTWDQGDTEREKKLTKYGSTGWRDDVESDDLKAYLASDASSDEDSEDEDNNAAKGSKMRKLLGLDSGGEEEASNDGTGSESDSEVENDGGRQIKLIPGKKDLEEKIRSKLNSGKEEPAELTPWQKYQEKRKQKRKECRDAVRGLKTQDENENDGDGRKHESKNGRKKDRDDFFDQSGSEGDESDKDFDGSYQIQEDEQKVSTQEKAREELELLLAGDHDEEKARDYDIRGIQRMEKNKGKKLKGSRKRKEEKVTGDVSGTNFKVDVNDDRFKAVLDGSDDRFGIDKTDPNFKDTSAMREILSEQTKRRKKKRHKTNHPRDVAPDVSADGNVESASGTNALSSLVQRLKSRVEGQKSIK
jgi:hypothetical protein